MKKMLIGIIIAAIIIPVGAYTISPLFIDTTIDEPLPGNVVDSQNTVDDMMDKETLADGKDMIENDAVDKDMMKGDDKEMMDEDAADEDALADGEVTIENDAMDKDAADEDALADGEVTIENDAMDKDAANKEMMDDGVKDKEMTEEDKKIIEDDMMDEQKSIEDGMMDDSDKMADEEMTDKEMHDKGMEDKGEMIISKNMTEHREDMMKEEMPTEMTKMYEGKFMGTGDGIHEASGIAKVLSLEGDKQILRLEDFHSSNGPDLYVYLASDKMATEHKSLGKLKANNGNQNYNIPEGTDLDKYNQVLIWCKQFSALFGNAQLTS